MRDDLNFCKIRTEIIYIRDYKLEIMKRTHFIKAIFCIVFVWSTTTLLTSQSVETESTVDIRMNSTTGTPHILLEEVDASSGGSTRIEFRNSNDAINDFEIRTFLHPSSDQRMGWYYNSSPRLVWNEDDSGLGVGTSSIQQRLTVNGAIKVGNTTANVGGSIRYTGSDFEGYTGGSWMSLTGGGGGGTSPWTVNGADIYYDIPGNEYLGVGTTNPSSALHVIAMNSAGETVDFTCNGDLLSNADLLNLTMTAASSDNAQFIECRKGTDLVFRVNGDGSVWAGTDKFRVVGSTGDVYVTDSSAGVILTSPNGNCWRMTIDNSGVPSYTNVSCP